MPQCSCLYRTSFSYLYLHLSLYSLLSSGQHGSFLCCASMYCFKTLSWFLLPLLLLECSQSSAQHTSSAVTAVASSSSLSPSCLQSRAPTASSAAAIQSSIVSDDSISKACDTSTQQWITTSGTQKTYYALDSTYFFNISLASGVTGGPTDQECTNFFNTILSSCVMSQNFWGGWIVSSATNYSST